MPCFSIQVFKKNLITGPPSPSINFKRESTEFFFIQTLQVHKTYLVHFTVSTLKIRDLDSFLRSCVKGILTLPDLNEN